MPKNASARGRRATHREQAKHARLPSLCDRLLIFTDQLDDQIEFAEGLGDAVTGVAVSTGAVQCRGLRMLARRQIEGLRALRAGLDVVMEDTVPLELRRKAVQP